MEQLLSTKTVRKLLDVSDRALRRWIAGGRFPQADVRIGTTLRWKESTVKTWLERKVGQK
ncbi:MAG: helix-turn-helix domain-containing protein [Planctomycetes bacterium]|nr:helix-turn-helix domain-containing protein [Planctomycetota bacterium]